jgi:hypothetical protein
VPDWALDQHTARGKRLGRGLTHFLTEGARLIPPPETKDPCEDEAYRLWALKARVKFGGELSANLPKVEVRKFADLLSPQSDAAEQGKLALGSPEENSSPVSFDTPVKIASDAGFAWLESGRPLAAPLTAANRKRMAERLYGTGDWTMERIATALGVGKSTVARDLQGFPTVGKPPRPKGGRPKGATR